MSRPVCLSIQSAVVAGHVGHGAATPALSLWNAVAVWPLPTVLLSNHAAVAGVEGRRLPGAEIAALGRGLAASGALARCDALLTGYLGSAEAAEAVADIAAAWRRARPGAPFLCDPVLGDAGKGLYLPAAVGELYRARLLPLADVAAPNLFELGWLTGTEPRTDAEILAAAHRLRALGPAIVFVTSVGQGARTGILTVTAAGAWRADAPRAPGHLNGAGDFTAAFLLARLLAGDAPPEAAARATAIAAALAAVAGGRDDLPVLDTATAPHPETRSAPLAPADARGAA